MKKITLLTTILISSIGFAQTNKQNIQTYLDSNRAKLGLTAQDVTGWTIENEVPGSGTKITSTYIAQRYQGIEVLGQSNAWVKDGTVINLVNHFKSDIAHKVNTTSASLSVIQALTSAYAKVKIAQPATFTITENLGANKFRLSDGIQAEAISAKLAYFPASENSLKLAWVFEFYAPKGHELWDVKIDATNGNLLEKNNLTITCSFDKKHNHADHAGHVSKPVFNFNNVLFNNGNNSMLVANPANYRVIPYNVESPNHGSFELITITGDAVASPNGWHDANAIGGTTASLKYTYTRGNNVLAQEDADGNNGTGIRPDGGAALNFDFPQYIPGVGQTLQPTAYTNAAVTNLFYMNNMMHDVWYKYGFDEPSGNFQRNNYGRGGAVSAQGDAINADAQDGWDQTTATLNNANFSSPADGAAGRMQMFMWNAGAPPTNFITVNSPSSIAGPRAATTNVFEGTDRIPVPTAPNGIVSDLVLYTNVPLDPLQNPNSACGPPTNAFDVAGKIVLIKRGGCFFSNKVKNAQDAGALAVIVADTIVANPVRLSMSSTGLLGITIPAVFVTKEIGDELITAMATETVNVKLEVPANLYLFADGDFDNGVIAHEYGHGISGRLTGGPTNSSCLVAPEQQGEGWSDWICLMMQLKAGDVGATPKGIATYAVNEPPTGGGIRNLPYSTDMAINPITFGASNGTLFDVTFIDPNDGLEKVEPHATGEIWATMLWDLTWAYVQKYGFNADIYAGTGGNNKVMRIVLDAMKLQGCNPSYIQARDAIIAADQATTGGQDFCMIWKVFARRGMGVNASSGSNTGNSTNIAAITDQVEDFTEPAPGPNCTLAVDYFSNEQAVRVYPNPANGMVNVRISQYVGKVTFQVVDLNGRVVFNQTDENFNIEKSLNLSGFQSGVYILKVVGDNLNFSQKLIKN